MVSQGNVNLNFGQSSSPKRFYFFIRISQVPCLYGLVWGPGVEWNEGYINKIYGERKNVGAISEQTPGGRNF